MSLEKKVTNRPLIHSILKKEDIDRLIESGKIRNSTPKINYDGRTYILIFYNNSAGLVTYEFDKEKDIYIIKRNKDFSLM